MTLKQIFEKPWSHEVRFDESTGEHFMDVVAGGVGLYVIRFRLTAEEVEAFGHNEAALDGLAQKVRYAPDRFADRRVTTETTPGA